MVLRPHQGIQLGHVPGHGLKIHRRFGGLTDAGAQILLEFLQSARLLRLFDKRAELIKIFPAAAKLVALAVVAQPLSLILFMRARTTNRRYSDLRCLAVLEVLEIRFQLGVVVHRLIHGISNAAVVFVEMQHNPTQHIRRTI